MHFKDRVEAGQQLAWALEGFRGRDMVVYGLPRGGVVTAAEVAKELGAPLDVIISRKIGHPISSEYAIGAITEHGEPLWSEADLGSINEEWRKNQAEQARDEARRRRLAYQSGRSSPKVQGKTAVIVDDGVATGLTLMAAIESLRQLQPSNIIVAVPVIPEDLFRTLSTRLDGLVALYAPREFLGSVGAYYTNFDPVEDEEVRLLLDSYTTLPPAKPLDLEALNSLLATLKRYPVSSEELASEAKRLHTPDNVVQFFESIPTGTTFKNKADVIRRSEQAELLMEEEAGEPEEHLHSYE